MSEGSGLRTRASLLARLRDTEDAVAWDEFVARYGPRITAWCLAWRLQEADAHDVTQTVLLQLAVKLRRFNYEPGRSFRGWLRTLTRHAWSEFAADRGRAARAMGGDDAMRALGTVEACADLESRLAEAFDLELLDEAMARVRARVAAKTWEAFRLTAQEGRSGAEAAAALGLSVAAAFKAKSNVQKLIQEEIRALETGVADADDLPAGGAAPPVAGRPVES